MYRNPVGGAVKEVRKQCERWKKAAEIADDESIINDDSSVDFLDDDRNDDVSKGHVGVTDAVDKTNQLETVKKRKTGDAGENLPYKYVPGAKSNSTMLYSISEKQLYRSLPPYYNMLRFVCRVPRCKAVLYMVDGRLTRWSKFKEHNHENQEEMAQRNEFEIAVREKCRTELLKASEAFEEALKEWVDSWRVDPSQKMLLHELE